MSQRTTSVASSAESSSTASGPPGGHEVLVDLVSATARVTGAYANFVLTVVDDHIVRMSVMTEPFYWHRHPDSDETFLVIQRRVLRRSPFASAPAS